MVHRCLYNKREPEDLWPSLEQTMVFYIWSHFYTNGELYGFPKSEQTHIASKLRNKLEHAAEENLEERREYPYDYSTWRKC